MTMFLPSVFFPVNGGANGLRLLDKVYFSREACTDGRKQSNQHGWQYKNARLLELSPRAREEWGFKASMVKRKTSVKQK